jgi:hypothetical protein
MDTSGMDSPDVMTKLRHWVTQYPIRGAALAGLIATQLATICGYYFRGIGLPQVPWPLYNGVLFAPGTVNKDFSNWGNASQFFVGQSVHMVDGVLFGILFAVLAHGMMPIKASKTANLQKGLLYGTVLAIISAGFLVPYVYVPHQGYGFFSFAHKPEKWKLPVSILFFHLVYGFFLGTLYNPVDKSTAS